MSLTNLERKALEAVDVDALLALLADLIAIRSLGGQETPAQEYVADFLEGLDMDVDVWELDLDTVRKHPAFSMEIERPGALGVVGTMGRNETDGRTLVLNGHVDVVPADEEGWHYSPWQATRVDGRVYGRGTCDMKGGLACALHAVQILRQMDVQLEGRLLIESVVGEEDGGVGTLAAVLRGYGADGAIVLEPTESVIAPAQAGALSFRVRVPGRTAHGSMREEGVSAIEKFFPIHEALLQLERSRNEAASHALYARYELPYALCIGKVEGGDWASNVADWLVFQGRYGVAPDENLATARRRFEETVAEVAQDDPWLRDHPPEVEWWGAQWIPASTPTDHPLVEAVAAAFAEASGAPGRIEGMTYGADMGLLVTVGQMPTVLFGPGDVRNAHRPDEFVEINELVAVTRTLLLTILRFCGGTSTTA